jgi:hypothetical protein
MGREGKPVTISFYEQQKEQFLLIPRLTIFAIKDIYDSHLDERIERTIILDNVLENIGYEYYTTKRQKNLIIL